MVGGMFEMSAIAFFDQLIVAAKLLTSHGHGNNVHSQ